MFYSSGQRCVRTALGHSRRNALVRFRRKADITSSSFDAMCQNPTPTSRSYKLHGLTLACMGLARR